MNSSRNVYFCCLVCPPQWAILSWLSINGLGFGRYASPQANDSHAVSQRCRVSGPPAAPRRCPRARPPARDLPRPVALARARRCNPSCRRCSLSSQVTPRSACASLADAPPRAASPGRRASLAAATPARPGRPAAGSSTRLRQARSSGADAALDTPSAALIDASPRPAPSPRRQDRRLPPSHEAAAAAVAAIEALQAESPQGQPPQPHASADAPPCATSLVPRAFLAAVTRARPGRSESARLRRARPFPSDGESALATTTAVSPAPPPLPPHPTSASGKNTLARKATQTTLCRAPPSGPSCGRRLRHAPRRHCAEPCAQTPAHSWIALRKSGPDTGSNERTRRKAPRQPRP